MANPSLGRVAYVLALVGGILLVIFSLLGLLGYAFMGMMSFGMGGFFAGSEILSLILGIVAVIFAKRVTDLVWAIILIIIGIIIEIIGGGIGGLLVLLGGILGLVAKYA